MKNKPNSILAMICAISIIVAGYSIYVRATAGSSKPLMDGFPGDSDASYKHIERFIYWSDFGLFELGEATYKEIVDEVGESNGFVGEENPMPYWQLVDSSCATLFFEDDGEGGYGVLVGATITDPSGRVFVRNK